MLIKSVSSEVVLLVLLKPLVDFLVVALRMRPQTLFIIILVVHPVRVAGENAAIRRVEQRRPSIALQ